MKQLGIFALMILAGCDSQANPATSQDLFALKLQVDSLSRQLNAVQSSQAADYVSFSPGQNDGWSWVSTGPYALRASLKEVTPQGNGSKLRLVIGNPLATQFSECSVNIMWAETDASGVVIPSSRHDKIFDLEPVASGFTFHNAAVADIPPEKLGRVTLSRLRCSRW